MERLLVSIYILGDLGTFVYLTLFDGYIYNAWNWVIAVPVNIFLSLIWPAYWGVLHWVT